MRIHPAHLIVVLPAALVAAGCAKGEDQKPSTLYVIEHAETDKVQHVGPPNEKDSVGDILTFANPLYDEANTKKVGSDNGVCFRTAVGSAYECFWTATLSDGQLTVEGPFYDGKASVLAITGGTGGYQAAHGQMALHARNPEGTEYDFTYTIDK
ncbi:allene oxide cyclase family protein [Candidatus Mycobacterium methanotrophicum]|uniref:Allene oxide cyclase n=1 Tax=Candidatus Mycobacterium methanotrophicum TaxID=2943498 RepID=A0ABY4QTT4_9MYCO|nr:allene oxide cyclase family protein [Candidatus Mycobacterium methanotrophicum]UQX13591.1 hypothetical protein M5I08_25735 [Candidatus Mycobacterium methanotrophicum]